MELDILSGPGKPGDVRVETDLTYFTRNVNGELTLTPAVIAALNNAPQVGDIKMSTDLITASAAKPWHNLSSPNAALAAANWPQLVPYLRALPLRYDPLNTNKTAFDVTAWAIAANVATLTFANAAPEQKILNALAEDNLVHGSFVNWRTITLPADVGNIVAGDYAISAIDTVARTISFAYIAGNSNAAGAFVASFYAHRIAGSAITARHFATQGRGFVTVQDSDSEWIGNLRRRDRGQGHRHATIPNESLILGSGAGAAGAAAGFQVGVIGNPTTDTVNGTPRTGATTDIRATAVFAYIYGGTYTP